MSFIFMVFHWPEPGGAEALAASMREFGDALRGTPGLLSVEPPHVTEDGECLVGITKWESEDAFRAAITLRAGDEVVPGESRPRQRFLLHEVP
jgi:heme-degrading monooxygenase HmoA